MIEKLKFFGTISAVVLVLIFILMIIIAVRKRKKFKAFLSEPLIAHLGDPLNPAKYEDWREHRSDVYIYGQMARYAEQAAFQSIPKRKRFDKDGMYTSVSQQRIAENMGMLNMVLTNDGFCLNREYGEFISEYRPYYTVADFYKSILEYFSFKQNPDIFEKPKPVEEETVSEDKSMVVDEPVYQDQPNGSEMIYEEDDYQDVNYNNSSFYSAPIVHFSTNITVDHQIMGVLQDYSEKVAKKSCDKQGIGLFDAYGEQTPEYKNACRNNYNKLCKIFFDSMKFKKEFVDWINSCYPNMDDVSMFDELIPMYIRHIKGKE